MKESGTVCFLLNGAVRSINFHEATEFTPTTTLLQYLRAHPSLQGTKEGCAEGDCGACTVAIASIDDQSNSTKLKVEACDSCLIFLPMLHGKAVITVEHIGSLLDLHPVQQAMVDHDGSQCGYCTPGFVMSLYTLYQNHQDPNLEVIQDALTGNLCRCTGYRSIISAALDAQVDHPSINDSDHQQLIDDIKALETHPLAIVGSTQKYFQPYTLEDAVRLRSMYPAATLINGATDCALRVTKNDELIEEIIDLSALKELKFLTINEQQVSIGCGISLETIKSATQEVLPALYESLKVFGSVQIRNLATLGGNLGSASPIGDTLPVLMAYHAQVELHGPNGKRHIAVREFVTGYRQTVLAAGEIIVAVHIPIPSAHTQVKWYKISKRKDLDISTVSAGFRLELDTLSQVKDIDLFYGGMAAMTKNAHKTTEELKGKPWSRQQVEQSMRTIDQDFTPISDARAQAEGRAVMARNLLLKFWSDTHV